MHYNFADLLDELGFTYLDRFYEKMAYKVANNLNKNVSALSVINELASEICFTDDGYLYCIIDNFSNALEDMYFRLESVKKTNSYVLLIDDKVEGTVSTLSSPLKSIIEAYFYVQ